MRGLPTVERVTAVVERGPPRTFLMTFHPAYLLRLEDDALAVGR